MYDNSASSTSAMNESLRGTVVLVHPKAEVDPLSKRNQVGVICEANINLDDIYVDFVDKIGLFSADALLTFLPAQQIRENLLRILPGIKAGELNALRRIDALVRNGDVTQKFNAMRTARDHPAIQPMCVEILGNQIARNIIPQYGRD